MEEKEETFTHEVERESLIFPIDYTSREYEKEFKRDPRAFREHVLRNALFRDILLDLAVPADGIGNSSNIGQSNRKKGCSDPMPPIPLEAMPFLDSFYQLAQNTDQGYHQTFFLADPRRAEDIENFWGDLCNSLFKRTVPPKDSKGQDLDAFFRHIFFQNEKFTSALLSPIWEQEVLKRLKKIQELANQVDLLEQIGALKECLISLDRISLALQSKIDNSVSVKSASKSGKATPEDLQNLLRSLLSARQEYKRVNDGIVSYNLPNLDIADENTLKQAFEELGTRQKQQTEKSRKLLTRARKAYLLHLVEEVRNDEALDREQQYIDLWNYLRASSSHTIDSVEKVIQERCRGYCQKIIDFYTYSSELSSNLVPPSTSSSYIDELLDFLINEHINQALYRFRDTFQLVAFYNACQAVGTWYSCYDCTKSILEGNHDSTRMESEKQQAYQASNLNDSQEYLLRSWCIQLLISSQQAGFNAFFQRAWEFIYGEESFLFNEGKYNSQYLKETASRLWKDGQFAGQFFSRGELVLSSIEEASVALKSCSQIFLHSAQLFPSARFWDSISKILQTLLLLILQKVVTDKVPELVEYVSPLFAQD